jgi:Family of unknown function (DUF5681)
MSDEMDYEVGYGKPPKHTQFRKGQSGNPKGRPKKELSIPELIRKVSLSTVTVKGENGQYYEMPKTQAAITQLVNAAVKGDPKALRLWLQLLKEFPLLLNEPLASPSVRICFPNPYKNYPLPPEDPQDEESEEN